MCYNILMSPMLLPQGFLLRCALGGPCCQLNSQDYIGMIQIRTVVHEEGGIKPLPPFPTGNGPERHVHEAISTQKFPQWGKQWANTEISWVYFRSGNWHAGKLKPPLPIVLTQIGPAYAWKLSSQNGTANACLIEVLVAAMRRTRRLCNA